MRWHWRRQHREDQLERELRAHIELESEERQDADAARRAFGNMTRVKEDVREAWGWSRLERFAQDLKYAVRQMGRNKGFTAAAVFTLVLGLGATTAMFSIVNGVLLEPLKYPEPGRLFLARTVPPPRAKLTRDFPVNAAQFDRWRRYCRGCDRMALAKFEDFTLLRAAILRWSPACGCRWNSSGPSACSRPSDAIFFRKTRSGAM